jgi:hypothetical protein
MRKIGKTGSPIRKRLSSSNGASPHSPDISIPSLDMKDERPLRVAGATISGWSRSLEIDLGALLARRPAGASIASAAVPDASICKPDHLPGHEREPLSNGPPAETVSLSDGTNITFATTSQFEVVNSV